MGVYFSSETSCVLGIPQTQNNIRLNKALMNQPLWWNFSDTTLWVRETVCVHFNFLVEN